jgi:hypothetical protein
VDQDKGSEKKVSIGDALDAIRSGRNLPAEAKSNAPKLPVTGNFEYQRVSPSYWLENLQEGVQRSRDQLFDSIANNPKSSNGMARRDLHASESFFVPSEWMDEVDLTASKESTSLERSASQEITIGGPAPGSETSSDINSEGVRFNSTENLNVQGLHVEELESEDVSGEPKLRINPMIREIFKKKSEG